MISKKWQMPLFITLFIFALLISTQYRTQLAYMGSLSSQKSEDLVAIVKSLNEKRASLEAEVSDLSQTKRTLEAQALEGTSLSAGLTNELHNLQLLTGAIPVAGPGITVTITGDSNLMSLDIIDLINELWVSGAEVVAVNDTRITSSTSISQEENDQHKIIITMNDQPLLSPVVIKAIGNADTLEKGLTFTGGIVDNLNTLYQVYPVIKKSENIRIPSIGAQPALEHLQ